MSTSTLTSIIDFFSQYLLTSVVYHCVFLYHVIKDDGTLSLATSCRLWARNKYGEKKRKKIKERKENPKLFIWTLGCFN